jgi:hypothetical protein
MNTPDPPDTRRESPTEGSESKMKILYDNVRLRVLTTTQDWGVPHLIATVSLTGLVLSIWDRVTRKKG